MQPAPRRQSQYRPHHETLLEAFEWIILNVIVTISKLDPPLICCLAPLSLSRRFLSTSQY